jgi:hypothetical protein
MFSYKRLGSAARGAVAVVAVGIGTATIPAALAAPAQATTWEGGCSVTPYRPAFDGFNTSGVKQVKFEINVNCAANRTIHWQQRYYERDSTGSQYQGGYNGTWRSTPAYSKNFSPSISLPNTDTDDDEEMYQQVRFQVCASQVCSPWTAWEKSGVTSMPN